MRAIRRFRQLGVYRDSFLVTASVVYLLGYVSWAHYAATNGLGMVPVLDAQYLVAGLIPALIAIITVRLVRLQLTIWRAASAEPSAGRYSAGTMVFSAGKYVLVGAGLALVVADWVNLERLAAVATIVLPFAGYAAMVGALLQGNRGERFPRYYGLGVIWIMIVFVPVIAGLMYVDKIFPRVPAAFGGPAPQCLRLDVVSADLSRSMKPILLEEAGVMQASRSAIAADTTPHDPAVVRTRAVDVLFATADVITFRVDGEGKGARAHSLAKRSIVSTSSCGTEGTTR